MKTKRKPDDSRSLTAKEKQTSKILSKETKAEAIIRNDLVESYRGMIFREAKKAWLMLTPQTRSWVGIDDMFEEGLIAARTHYAVYYSTVKGAQFGTFLCHSIRNYFYGHFIAVYNKRESQCEAHVEHITDLQERASENGTRFDVKSDVPNQETLVLENDSAIVFLRIHEDASDRLKKYLIQWFLNRDTKHQLRGKEFKKARKEFRSLATQHGLTIDDCRAILRSPTLLDFIARQILWAPYDINNPCPAVDMKPRMTAPIRFAYNCA